jgi:hypothetical protein
VKQNPLSIRSTLVFVVAAALGGCSEALPTPPAPAPQGGAAGQAGGAGAGSGGSAGATAAGKGGMAGSGGGAGTAGMGAVPLGPTFASVASIMRENCGPLACHGGGPDGQDLIFVNLDTLYTTLTTKVVKECFNNVLVVPGDVANSALPKLPTWQCTDFVMPQGCIDDPCIAPAELDAIRGWIAAGAPR